MMLNLYSCNFDLYHITLQVMRSEKIFLNGYRYATSELFMVIAIVGNKELEHSIKLSEEMVCAIVGSLTVTVRCIFDEIRHTKTHHITHGVWHRLNSTKLPQ